MSEPNVNLQRREFVKSLPIYVLDRIQSALSKAIRIGEKYKEDSEMDAARAKVARINVSRCLAWGNSLCQACYLACPLRDRALEIVDQKPIINIAACDGCGFCIPACQMVNDQVAIELV